MDEGNSGSPGSCPPLSPLVLPWVPNAGPLSWSVPIGPLNPLGSPVGASLLGENCKGAHMVEALSQFLDPSSLDKMIPEGLVLGPLSF